jgi:hypothetical protein
LPFLLIFSSLKELKLRKAAERDDFIANPFPKDVYNSTGFIPQDFDPNRCVD